MASYTIREADKIEHKIIYNYPLTAFEEPQLGAPCPDGPGVLRRGGAHVDHERAGGHVLRHSVGPIDQVPNDAAVGQDGDDDVGVDKSVLQDQRVSKPNDMEIILIKEVHLDPVSGS